MPRLEIGDRVEYDGKGGEVIEVVGDRVNIRWDDGFKDRSLRPMADFEED